MGNLKIARGDTKTLNIVVREESGTFIDITGWTISFTASYSIPKTSVKTDDSAAISIVKIVEDGESGSYLLYLSSDDTNIKPDPYKYDIQIKNPDESVVITYGVYDLIIEDNVTRG